MSMTTLRRTGALIGSAALLASMTVATVAAPAAAGKCEPFTGSFPADPADCYYATDPIDGIEFEWDGVDYVPVSGLTVPAGVTLNGTDERSERDLVYQVDGTFNGGGGNDWVAIVTGTFNGGPGIDTAGTVEDGATFTGGSGTDRVVDHLDGTFYAGGGDDYVEILRDGTFYGGGGYEQVLSSEGTGTCYSVERVAGVEGADC
jgi:hypothetical protein